MPHDPRDHDHVPRQHKARAPASARVYVITCSDSRTEATDEGGRLIQDRRARHSGAQVVLLTGGTGITSRDSTFETVAKEIARPLPGFGELFRMLSFQEIGSAAMLSRASAGVTKDGLVIFAMPGSPAAVRLACERLILPELGHLIEELGR